MEGGGIGDRLNRDVSEHGSSHETSIYLHGSWAHRLWKDVLGEETTGSRFPDDRSTAGSHLVVLWKMARGLSIHVVQGRIRSRASRV